MCRFSRLAMFAVAVSLVGLSQLMAQSKPSAQVRFNVYVFTCSRDMLGKTNLAIGVNDSHKLAHLSAQECDALRQNVREQKNTKVVSEPTLLGPNAEWDPSFVTLSGEPVKFLSGSKVLVAPNKSEDSIQFLDYVGFKMTLLPKVQELGNVYLEMTPSLRTIDEGLGIVVGGEPVSGIREQEEKVAIDLNSDQWAGLALNGDPTSRSTKDRVTLILVKTFVSPGPVPLPVASSTLAEAPRASPVVDPMRLSTLVPSVAMVPAPRVDSAKRIAAMLVEEYHAACRDQNNELAAKLARQALELDPTCFHQAATPSIPAISR